LKKEGGFKVTNKPDLVLLFSGGFDSTVLLELAIALGYNPLCLTFNYGQTHSREVECAKKMCEEKKVEQQIINIPFPVRSALTTGEKSLYSGVSPWYVPSRNLIFIAYAASIAEERGINLIWYGANYSGFRNRVPDCTQEWVGKVNEVLQQNGSFPITLVAPLLGMSNELVATIGKKLFGVSEEKVLSGYGQSV